MADDLRLTDTQRNILEALCRPSIGESRFAPPATNQEIADELYLSVDAIKAHLRVLYRKFGIEPLPHNQKRARLVELAFERGVVSDDGRTEQLAPGPQEPSGPNVVAVPAERAPDEAGPAHPATSMPRQRRPGRLIVIGVVLGLLIIAAVAVILISDGSGSERLPKAEVVRQIRSACKIGIDAAGPVPRGQSPDPANTLSAITTVSSTLDDAGAPTGDQAGLDKFSSGLDQARVIVSGIARGVAGGPSAFANLTFFAGKIEAGSVEFGLGGRGSACYAIGARVGATQPNPG